MNKKDRIAVVISVIYALLPLFALMNSPKAFLVLSVPLVLYWGYRFIRNDISFLGMKERE